MSFSAAVYLMSFPWPIPAMCTRSGIGMSVVKGLDGGVGSAGRPVDSKVMHRKKSQTSGS